MVRGFTGLHITKLDGRDYFDVRRKGAEAIQRVRAGQGPGLIHATVTRPYSHSLSDDQRKYRTHGELVDEQEHDPLLLLEQELIDAGALSRDEATEIRESARADVAQAATEALAAPRPDPAQVMAHLYAPPAVIDLPPDPPTPPAPSDGGDAPELVTFGEAIRRTLHEEMARDERITVFGEDVADADPSTLDAVPGKGGVFGITFGLQREFGQARCYNTPLAESNIVGRAVGQGIRGLRPSPEIQFFDYIWPAMQQLRSEAATTRWRSNGAFSCPMVLRVPIGGYLTGGAIWHSQCGESIFAHCPGLQIVFPSRARRRRAAAHRVPGRGPGALPRAQAPLPPGVRRDPMPPPDWLLPFGRGAFVTRGSAVTVVTWGATVREAVLAAREVDPEGGAVEIIDLRTIIPWDQQLVAESVARTGRVLVLHEDTLTCGFGAEIAAWIADECFEDLDAPVLRLAALDVPVGYEPTLEAAVLPQVDDIARDLRHLLAY